MATILVYGDSNSHGTIPLEIMDVFGRFPKGHRWPDIMEQKLAVKIDPLEVINESLPGRTTVHDDVVDGGPRNGLKILPSVLLSHRPIDLLIIMLGTNDLKARFGVGAYEIARSVRQLILAAKASETVKDIFIVSPVSVKEIGALAPTFKGAEERQKGLADHLLEIGELYDAGFLNADQHIEVSLSDGVHFERVKHVVLGEAMAEAVGAFLEARHG